MTVARASTCKFVSLTQLFFLPLSRSVSQFLCILQASGRTGNRHYPAVQSWCQHHCTKYQIRGSVSGIVPVIQNWIQSLWCWCNAGLWPFSGGWVLVRGLGWSTDQCLAERAASHPTDQCMWHPLLHLTTSFQPAACECLTSWVSTCDILCDIHVYH